MDAIMPVTTPEPLTESESLALTDLEGVIERGLQMFVDVGAALSVIRRRRLYRRSHETFETYCQERWGWSRQRAAQLIGAAEVVAELSTIVDTPPTNEGQARALLDVPPEHRAEVLTEAQSTAQAEGKKVTAKRIQSTGARRALPKPKKAEAPETELVPEPEPVTNAEPVVVDAETEPAEGAVVVFVRALAVPEHDAVDGMTDADLETVRLLQAWCARVIGAYARRTIHVA